MKRLRLWLNELTLTQQLLLIIFLFVVIFAGFVFVFLSPAIDKFSETEMFRILHSSQESFIQYMDTNNGELPDFNTNADEFVTDVIYDPATAQFIFFGKGDLSEDMKRDIIFKTKDNLSGTQDYVFKTVRTDSEGNTSPATYLYSMSQYQDGRYILSIMSDSYRMSFRTSLINSVITMNILFVSVLFVLLMIWVGYLIIPLSQIKNHLTKMKNDEQAAPLNIKRNDEIGEVAYALQEMEDELARQNREKEEMIQNISHDLKTPIATIKSYGESIKDGIYPYETLEKSVDVIIEHASRLEKKVRSLIVLNKMGYLLDDCEEGEHLDMNKVVDMAVLSLKVIRPEIEFRKEAEETVYFHGEEEPWRIVVENLIDNALRYARTYIRIVLKPGELQVINDGTHIDPEIAKKIFRPYEKGTDGQFGLGLSIVNKVVTTYGYHVQAENTTDGVCFRINAMNSNTKAQKKKRAHREKPPIHRRKAVQS